jgi:hypothetical protein
MAGAKKKTKKSKEKTTVVKLGDMATKKNPSGGRMRAQVGATTDFAQRRR